MSWPIALAIGIAAMAMANVLYLAWYFHWEVSQTSGVSYFGRTTAGRRELKRQIRRRSRPALPLARLLSLTARTQTTLPAFEYQGVCGPPRVSSPEIFARASRYQPRPADVFVATQMRCGTTWMQQVVYQVVTRGQGEFTDEGLRHMYAVSPWIDAANSVSLDDAPLVGEPPVRIIKTHLPAALCPYAPEARYIYVARHPVSCFASIVDFNRSTVGPVLPPVSALATWFCSDRMYWSPWPEHVNGWWQWAEDRRNVLFVHFEEMTRDLGAVVDRVASFLGVSLSPAERQRVVDKCTFQFMKAREEYFEMTPPTIYSVRSGQFLKSGSEHRHEDVSPAVRAQILGYCKAALDGRSYPAGRFYPDLAGHTE
jgi:hypothetical protein